MRLAARSYLLDEDIWTLSKSSAWSKEGTDGQPRLTEGAQRNQDDDAKERHIVARSFHRRSNVDANESEHDDVPEPSVNGIWL